MSQFIKNVTDWVRRKGIQKGRLTENQLVFNIIKKIWEKGIKARPFINSGYNNDEDVSKVLPFLDDYFEKWADDIFEEITKKLEDDMFK